jgi:phenylalanyl-tRNA synthetase alpha chain
MSDLEVLEKRAAEDIARAGDAASLEAVRVAYLGRKGELTGLLRTLKELPIDERRVRGTEANEVRERLESALSARDAELRRESKLEHGSFDTTKPGHRVTRGHIHPLSKIDEEVRRIFTAMNFSVVEGPEVETPRYNFDALNIPADHPARDLWDRFWLGSEKKEKPDAPARKLLLQPHTSPMQFRYMGRHNPPFQIIVPGRVFRYEATDASHEFNFYQVEGLMVGPDVSLANFKYIVEEFFARLFGKGIEFRFRPSYFPFVEPGVEVDIKIPKNTKVGARTGEWLEVMGAGMVHRNVFDAVRYNPDEVQGFAFGVGLDRLAMLKYGIPDIRLFYSGDARFTRQF